MPSSLASVVWRGIRNGIRTKSVYGIPRSSSRRKARCVSDGSSRPLRSSITLTPPTGTGTSSDAFAPRALQLAKGHQNQNAGERDVSENVKTKSTSSSDEVDMMDAAVSYHNLF